MIDLIWKGAKDITKCNMSNIYKVWDHKTGDPESVTAGIKGMHVYVLANPDNPQIMGVVSNP